MGSEGGAFKEATELYASHNGEWVAVPLGSPADHVYSSDMPALPDRKRFWISGSSKYGSDRTTTPNPVTISGTPVKQSTAYADRAGSCVVNAGQLVFTQTAATLTVTTGSKWQLLFTLPAQPGLTPGPEETLSGTIKIKSALTGYSSQSGYNQTGASYKLLINGVWKTMSGGAHSADGTTTWTLALSAADAAWVIAGGAFGIEVEASVTFFIGSSISFPQMVDTGFELTTEFKTTSPTIPRLYELIDGAYVQVNYPPV
jgi:hypothetical protein